VALRALRRERWAAGRPLEKHIHVFFYFAVFFKLSKEVRPDMFAEPGFSGGLGRIHPIASVTPNSP
jgi:hypothetical protein